MNNLASDIIGLPTALTYRHRKFLLFTIHIPILRLAFQKNISTTDKKHFGHWQDLKALKI